MANIIEVYNEITSAGLLDFAFNMSNPLQLPASSSAIKMQVCCITMSDRIPNVFNAGSHYAWNNRVLRARTALQPWTNILLPTGLYMDAEAIAAAINNVLGIQLDWYHDPLDPAIIFETNTITDVITITLNSDKLKLADSALELDMTSAGNGNSDLATTLGFSNGAALIVTAARNAITVSSNQVVRLDVQGTTADVWCNLVANRRRNNFFTRSVAEIVFAGKQTASENVYPTGGVISPTLVYDGNRTVKNVSIQIKRLDGLPMIFMSGRFFMSIAFNY